MIMQKRRPLLFYLNIAISIVLLIGGAALLITTYQNQPPPIQKIDIPALELGEPAPGFILPSLAGGTVALDDYAGQVVILNTWATWCPPCIAEMPMLNTFYEARRSEGVVVLAVNDKEDEATVAQFIVENGFRFPVLLDYQAQIIESYLVPGLPTTFIIDREGVVQYIHTGLMTEQQLIALVEPLL